MNYPTFGYSLILTNLSELYYKQVSSSTFSISIDHKQLITNNETLNFKRKWWITYRLLVMSQVLLPDALLPVQLLNQSDCTTLLIHYYFSYVPKFEARNIFYLIRVYTKIFIYLSPHFQHIVLINFLLLTHLNNSSMNYSYHLFIHSFQFLMMFLHLFIFCCFNLLRTSFLKHKTIKTSFL